MRGHEVREKAYLVGWSSGRGRASLRTGRGPGLEGGRHSPAPRPAAEASGLPDALDDDTPLQELAELTSSAGAQVVGVVEQRSPEPDPATLIGRGKVEAIWAEARAAAADLIVFDNDLTPSQLRNLEQALGLKVIDRTQLILDIFARRARSREGQLQVELAQLEYLLPRLSGHGTLLSRLGGGIGTRGPGEQKLEYDRRRVRTRIRNLRRSIESVRTQRALQRSRRRDRRFLTVALVGYTNAGKSTLFNALTRARVATSARLFATLDPIIRALPLESRRPILLSDTVGFIRKLPPHLVAAFRATLEELEDASLLLHVTDAAQPERDAQDAAVEAMLETLGVFATPRLHVWNKIDRLDDVQKRRLPAGPGDIAVSAGTGEGLEALQRAIDASLKEDPMVEADFDLSAGDGEHLALLYRSGTVLSTELANDRLRVRARVPKSLHTRLGSGPAKLLPEP